MPQPLGSPIFRAFDNNGDPLALGTLETYLAGTSTPLATYTTADLDIANPNPVALDADGEAQVWLQDALYKFILKNADGETQWTLDYYPGGPESAGVTGAIVPQTNWLDNGGFEASGVGYRPHVQADEATPVFFCDRWCGYRGGQIEYDIAVNPLDGMPSAVRMQRESGTSGTAGLVIGQHLGLLGGSASPFDVIDQLLNPALPGAVAQTLVFSIYLLRGADFSGTSATIEIVSNVSNENICSGSTWVVEASATIAASSLSASEWTRIQCAKTGPFTTNSTVLGVRIRFNAPSGTAGADDTLLATGAKLECNVVGVATAYIVPTMGEAMARCRRFYHKYGDAADRVNISAYGETGQNYDFPVQVNPPMGQSPTATVSGTWTVSNCGQPSIVTPNPLGFTLRTTVTSTGAFSFSAGVDDYIVLDAETA